jgi:UDP-3-O-[3-hydroxymyristoyl] glucosamine N-acyltransferase
VIGEYVEMGANNTIARGIMVEDSEIGSGTNTDFLVHIARCAKIGKRCLIPASAIIF